jgi:hypothetical protein
MAGGGQTLHRRTPDGSSDGTSIVWSGWPARRVIVLAAFAVVGAVGFVLGVEASRPGSLPVEEGIAIDPSASPPANAGARRDVPGVGLPRFTEDPRSDRDHLVPGRPGYSAAALVRYQSPRQLFDQEPRNETWARPLELALPGFVARGMDRLLPGFSVTSVACRTTICKVAWNVTGEKADRAGALMTYLLPPAVGMVMPDGYYVAFSGLPYSRVDWRNPGVLMQAISEQRQRSLRKVRAGDPRFPLPPGVQLADLPAE